nr:immunoglobulin light chain junction region [Macaca mulatta]MOX97233.1 immunoglobulin light chain junction region [Macaca mulatta]MOX97241.1 immunoglobulin light chain junction region [Macaca mulatta]MOX97318.1 immunoglobulin light chain junction region [Macaca mulatta]MOX97322.1 immunoglobulin light chain junction region [Macaca mulatta]
CQQYKDLLPTF